MKIFSDFKESIYIYKGLNLKNYDYDVRIFIINKPFNQIILDFNNKIKSERTMITRESYYIIKDETKKLNELNELIEEVFNEIKTKYDYLDYLYEIIIFNLIYYIEDLKRIYHGSFTKEFKDTDDYIKAKLLIR